MRVAFTTPNDLSKQFPFKDKTNNIFMKGLVVYQIGCKNCDSFYIGKTSRILKYRIEEHRNGSCKSALYDHHLQTGHSIDFDNVKILDRASNDRKLKLKEMLHIDNKKPDLNVQTQSYVFSLIIGNKIAGTVS